MDLKDFLEKNKIINRSQLAELMWEGNKSAKTKLSNKLSGNVSGTGAQRITEKDEKRAKEVLAGLAKNIMGYIHG